MPAIAPARLSLESMPFCHRLRNSPLWRRDLTDAHALSIDRLPHPAPCSSIAMIAAAAEHTVAVFDFELIDSSLEGEIRGPRPDEQEWLARAGDQLRSRLSESGRFSLIDLAPVAAEARASNLQACGGCDTRLAGRLGAELAVTGTVQKVSNLILNMNIYVREVQSGKLIAAMSADMRGNTDESWSRALEWLVRNRFLDPAQGVR